MAAAITALVSGAPASARAGKLSDETANFYRGQAESYENKIIKLEVTHLRPFTPRAVIEGVQFFHAFTYDDQENVPGGWMLIAVPVDQAAAMIKKYGTAADADGRYPLKRGKVETEKMEGLFVTVGQGVWLLDLTGGLKEKLDERAAASLRDFGGPDEGPVGRPRHPGPH